MADLKYTNITLAQVWLALKKRQGNYHDVVIDTPTELLALRNNYPGLPLRIRDEQDSPRKDIPLAEELMEALKKKEVVFTFNPDLGGVWDGPIGGLKTTKTFSALMEKEIKNVQKLGLRGADGWEKEVAGLWNAIASMHKIAARAETVEDPSSVGTGRTISSLGRDIALRITGKDRNSPLIKSHFAIDPAIEVLPNEGLMERTGGFTGISGPAGSLAVLSKLSSSFASGIRTYEADSKNDQKNPREADTSLKRGFNPDGYGIS